MPQRPLRACAEPGCAALVPVGRCASHAVALEHTRPNWEVRAWYRTVAWARLRMYVITEAACACASCGRITGDLDVDHIVKHEGDPTRFWNLANLQALCRTCHARKTGRGE
jgi:5-methylcytosine-specific restriction enzyme A